MGICEPCQTSSKCGNGDGEVVELLKIANGYLPRVRLEYDRINEETNSVKAELNSSKAELNNIARPINNSLIEISH